MASSQISNLHTFYFFFDFSFSFSGPSVGPTAQRTR